MRDCAIGMKKRFKNFRIDPHYEKKDVNISDSLKK